MPFRRSPIFRSAARLSRKRRLPGSFSSQTRRRVVTISSSGMNAALSAWVIVPIISGFGSDPRTRYSKTYPFLFGFARRYGALPYSHGW